MNNLSPTCRAVFLAITTINVLTTAAYAGQENAPRPKELPTKADAVKILKQVQELSQKRIVWQRQATNVAYEMAIVQARSLPAEKRPPYLRYTLLLHKSPEWTGKQYIGMAKEQLRGILALAGTLPETGSWKPAKELAGKESVRRWTAYHEVDENACYGFTDRNGDRLLMHWNGKQLSILCMESAALTKRFQAVTDKLRDDAKGPALQLQTRMVGSMGPYAAPAIPFYTTQLKSKQFYTRIMAASTLWKIDRNKEASLPVLSQAFLQAKDPKEKRDAAILLSAMGPVAKPWYKELSVYLEDPDTNTRIGIAHGLWRIDPNRNEPKAALRKLIVNTDNSVYSRKQACGIMAQVAPTELMQILQERISSPDESDAFIDAAEKMAKLVGF